MDFWWFSLISGFSPATHEEMSVPRWLCGIKILSIDVNAAFLQTDFAGKVPNAPYHPRSGLRKPRFSSKHKDIIRISYKIPGFQLKFPGFWQFSPAIPEVVRLSGFDCGIKIRFMDDIATFLQTDFPGKPPNSFCRPRFDLWKARFFDRCPPNPLFLGEILGFQWPRHANLGCPL